MNNTIPGAASATRLSESIKKLTTEQQDALANIALGMSLKNDIDEAKKAIAQTEIDEGGENAG